MSSISVEPEEKKPMLAKPAAAYQETSKGEDSKGEDSKGEDKNKDKKDEVPTASIREIFRFATGLDWLMMFFGACGAVVVGGLQPFMMVLFGDVMDAAGGQSGTGQALLNTFNEIAIKMLIIGGIAGGCAWLSQTTFDAASLRQSAKWRNYYLRGIVRQDVGWYDTNSPNELAGRISESTQTLQDGISAKLALGIRQFGQAVAGVSVAFYYSWRMSLFLIASSPIVVLGTWYLNKATTTKTKLMTDSYAKAGGIATESITSLRTVSSLGNEPQQIEKYDSCLQAAQDAGVNTSKKIGFGNGLLFASGNIMAAVGFMFGAYLMSKELEDTTVIKAGMKTTCKNAMNCDFTAGNMIIALFGFQMGAQALGLIEPALTAFNKARRAVTEIMRVTERDPTIDVFSEDGKKPESCGGRIEFKDVVFAYPSRPENRVADGYNLTVEAGTTVALVGASGSGKSTAIQLVERFYDPDDGVVSLDGEDLRQLNVKWLRNQIGLVGQEPVLFSGTIAENIARGKSGASLEEVQEAAKMSNAHDFIMEFPDGYDTDVGDGGGQLSGGQKQRVAIARAILKDPAILLLDEATSALDTESERVVQAALDNLLQKHKRTTIVIAHRLSTIQNADKICVVDKGKIVEQGTHSELMAIGEKGFYFKLQKKSGGH